MWRWLKRKLFGPMVEITFDQHLDLVTMYPRTPDLPQLEMYKGHPVFICDDLMTGHRRHHLLGDAERDSWAFTVPSFSVWKKKAGSETFPIPLLEQSPLLPFCTVKGEFYILPTETLKVLDNYKANGIQFIRQRVRIVVPHVFRLFDEDMKLKYTSREQRQYFSAWMYVGVPDFWDDQWNTHQFSKVNLDVWNWAEGEAHLLEDYKKYYYFKYKEYFEK